MAGSLLKQIARAIFGDYQIFRIYEFGNRPDISNNRGKAADWSFEEVSLEQIKVSTDVAIRERAWYLGEDAHAFGCIRQGRILALCVFWHGERYRIKRNFWPLAQDEAKLVEIITLPEARGQGIAGLLIEYASGEMFARGFHRLFARIWHSNLPSIRAFEKSGWQYLTTVLEIRPVFLGRRPLRFKINRP